MAKVRTTLTTCDLAECEESYAGDTPPETWLNVAIRAHGDEKPTRLVFCSYVDLSVYAQETSQILTQLAESSGD